MLHDLSFVGLRREKLHVFPDLFLFNSDQTIPKPSTSATPNKNIPVTVWITFMVILWRKRLPIITPVKAARIPVIIKPHWPSPMGLDASAKKNAVA